MISYTASLDFTSCDLDFSCCGLHEESTHVANHSGTHCEEVSYSEFLHTVNNFM